MVWLFARWIYTILFTCLLPWVFFRLWVRSLRLPAYRQRWLERLGYAPLPPLDNVLWVHAVSVGETLAAIPLVQRLKLQYPQTPILMTTTTPTGSERVQAAFKEKLGKEIYHCYLPYDLPWTLRSFFRRVKPKLLILMETELWPNLLECCNQKQIPVLIANARLSPKSLKHYRFLGHLMKKMLRPVQAVAAQSAIDVESFSAIGMDRKRIVETGNIKFDLTLPPNLQETGKSLRNDLGGASRMIWIAASTHEGEEAIMLKVYKALKKRFPSLLLLLVPRHPDRFNKVADLCEEQGLKVVRRSQNQPCPAEVDIFLGDTMGELLLFYAASDVAFVAGSFMPIGGHNLLEPAALGLPILTGPQLFNFVAISQMLVAAGGATIVQDEKTMEMALADLLADEEKGKEQGAKAKQVVEKNRGALDKLLHLIGKFQ
jgi:3-deoxy-D-manno-octulosonic-acid transferase